MCEQCHQEHAALQDSLAGVRGDIETHIHPEIESILGALHGPIVDELLEVRHHESGLIYKVNVMFSKTENGGIPAHLTASDRQLLLETKASVDRLTSSRALLTSAIGALGIVLAAVIAVAAQVL